MRLLYFCWLIFVWKWRTRTRTSALAFPAINLLFFRGSAANRNFASLDGSARRGEGRCARHKPRQLSYSLSCYLFLIILIGGGRDPWTRETKQSEIGRKSAWKSETEGRICILSRWRFTIIIIQNLELIFEVFGIKFRFPFSTYWLHYDSFFQ